VRLPGGRAAAHDDARPGDQDPPSATSSPQAGDPWF